MSLNDTEKWASLIIEEICEESKAFAKISKNTSTKDKEVRDENNYPKISRQDNDLNLHVSTSEEVQQSDFSNNFSKKLQEYSLTSNADTTNFNETYNDKVSKTSKDAKTVANMSSNCDTIKLDFVQETDKTKMVTDCVETAIEEEIKYIPEYEVATKSSNKEITLIDFDTDFLKKIETDSMKPNYPRKHLGTSVLFENENFLENSHENLGISHSSSFIEPCCEYDEENNENFWKLDKESTRISFEKLSSSNVNAIFGGEVGDNNISLDLSQVKCEFKSDDVSPKNLDEKVNIISVIETEGNIWGLHDKNFVNKQKSLSDTCLKIDFHSLLDSSPKMLSKISKKANHQSLDNIRGKIVTEINRYSDGFGPHEINNCNKSETVKLNCYKVVSPIRKYFKNEQAKDELTEDVQEICNEELKVRNGRINFVVSIYQSICATCETIFIRPLANIFADYFDFLSFIVFLSLCVLYMFYKKIQLLISNYRSLILEKFSNRLDNVQGKTLLDIGKDLPSASEALFIDENTSLRRQTLIANSVFEKDEIVKHKDIKSFILVEPYEVAASSVNYEIVTEYIKEKTYKRNENVLNFICREGQHRATIERNEGCLVNVRIISNAEDENNVLLYESDFDSEIVVSSETRHCYADEISSLEEYDNLHDLQKISKHHQRDSELIPTIKTNLNRSLTEIFSITSDEFDKPLLNSTEVDHLESEAFSEYENNSYFTALSSSEISYFEDDFKLKNSPESTGGNYLNSSLNVNLPSFASRSDFLSDSKLNKLEYFHNDVSEETADDVTILSEVKREIPCLNLSSSTLDEFAIIDSRKEIIPESISIENFREMNSKSTKMYIDEKLKNIKIEGTEILQTSNIADAYFKKNDDVLRSSFVCGDAKDMYGSSNSNNQSDLQMKEELVANKVKDNLKRKKSIRRRMSSILNSWRNMQMVPCVVKNIKYKKNYKTDDDTNE